ncbi:hypothetical protein HPB50_012185 [Hyalomma asiaticum]|uniref:Uncharacterized protein n=1 Tax=Hyalomma asiaticum TaxID=266040 RepID=A0ACB7SDU5_HYAAI|nr:hypothetical protein HPB50_012185 [Hyalomma asiaticum]
MKFVGWNGSMSTVEEGMERVLRINTCFMPAIATWNRMGVRITEALSTDMNCGNSPLLRATPVYGYGVGTLGYGAGSYALGHGIGVYGLNYGYGLGTPFDYSALVRRKKCEYIFCKALALVREEQFAKDVQALPGSESA